MPPSASAAPDAQRMAVADMLGRVGAELADLAAAVARLHPLAAAARAAARDRDYLQALQNLDLTEQTLRGLAGFLENLASAAPPAWRLDPAAALAALTLADLAARPAGQHPQPQDAAAPRGDCEFF